MNVSRSALVATALGTVGETERPPGSNRTRFGRWYGLDGVPWCAIWVAWVFAQHGHDLRRELTPGWAYTPAGLAAGRRAGWAIRHRDAQPGDIVFHDFRSGGDAVEHVSIAIEATDAGVVTVEGNTSPGVAGSQDNGGGVWRRVRPWSTVVGVLSAPYLSSAAPPPRPAPSPAPTIPDEEDEVAVIVDTPDGKSWHCAGTWRKEITRADADALAFLGTKRVTATPQFAALVDRTLQDTHGVSLAAFFAKLAAER